MGPSFVSMHSGSVILIWIAGVASVQVLTSWPLLLVLGACAIAAALLAPARSRRLVRRVRFLLLAIAILFAGFTPGEAVLVDFPSFSPSREGLVLAMVHSARLFTVVLCVAILIERLPIPRLVGGLFALMRPLQSLGFPAGRVAVRLLLVLHYAESGAPRDWKTWLQNCDDDEFVGSIPVVRERFRPFDLLAVLVSAIAVVALGLSV